jgi:hypothetical protein
MGVGRWRGLGVYVYMSICGKREMIIYVFTRLVKYGGEVSVREEIENGRGTNARDGENGYVGRWI